MKKDSPLMLSVSGARGIVGSTMTPIVAKKFAAAFGSQLREISGQGSLSVVLGRDGRASGKELADAAMAGLCEVGCDVIDIGISATPTIGVMINHLSCAGGINITASHNPQEWNGLKCLDSTGAAPVGNEANAIISRFHDDRIDFAEESNHGTIKHDEASLRIHMDLIQKLIDPKPIRDRNFKVVLDSINASGCLGGRALMEAYGCEFTHVNGDMTGIFAHTPEPTSENLEDLEVAVASEEDVACGFAQDPDADRLAIIDECGGYIGEEYTLVLAALRMLQRNGPGVIAVNLSTSRMIDDVAAQFPGSRVIRSAVGEANVVAALRENDALIGGEGNGGVIIPQVCWVRDSLASMALVLDLLANEERPLSEIIDTLPRYSMIKRKVDLSSVGGTSAITEVIQRIREAWPGAHFNNSDGIRIDLDEGWIHVRPSNTEPIVRLIAEASDSQTATAIIDEAANAADLG